MLKYRAFKDECRLHHVDLDLHSYYHVTFVIPMPPSWSKKKRAALDGKPHQQTPDKDNLEKGLLDALYANDAAAWDGRCTKVWGAAGAILIAQ